MDELWPQINSYLTVWWGVPGLVWILAATEGVKRLGIIPCRAAWIVSLAFGIAGGWLWAQFGDGGRLASEVAYGVRAAFLASGLFSAAKNALDQVRRDNTPHRARERESP